MGWIGKGCHFRMPGIFGHFIGGVNNSGYPLLRRITLYKSCKMIYIPVMPMNLDFIVRTFHPCKAKKEREIHEGGNSD